MKILLITEFFPTGKDLRFSGGVEARTYYVAKELAKTHKVTVVTSWIKGTRKKETLNGIKILRVGPVRTYQSKLKVTDFFSIVGFIRSAIKVGASLKPEIVDGGNVICHLIARQIGKKNEIPVVFWYPDVYIGQWLKTYGLLSGSIGFLLEKYNLWKKANLFISISKETEKKLINQGISKSKLKIVPCGVDFKEFQFNTQKEKTPSIVCVSRLVKYKNVEDIVWSVGYLRKKGINCKLKIIGTGQEENNIKQIIKMAKLKSVVKLYKNLTRKELIQQIKLSTIMCLPSSVEGFGISLIEGAASGLPYVASNINVFKEITKDGQGGLFFKLNDVEDLSEKLKLLLKSSVLYSKKSLQAKNLAKNYSWLKIAKETANSYKPLL